MRRRATTVAMVLMVLVVAGAVTRSGVARRTDDPTRTFDLTGIGALGRWTLEPVTGLNVALRDFEPATLFVETGEAVVLHLRSADVFHRFYLPEFAVGPIDVEPGHTATVRFTASHKGVFQFYCTSMCGTCHFQMRGWIVVTDHGDSPIVPPALSWAQCVREAAQIPPGTGLVEAGALLYTQKGCATCHGPAGRGGVPNDNSTRRTVPAHDTTAEKFFLRTREDADAFIRVLEASGDLASGADAGIPAFPIVRARFLQAREIIKKGRFTTGADPRGPQPPLQMPAWQFLLEEREIDALLAYFVSLHSDRDEAAPGLWPR
jgi:mono/diheme cytochrome c family protein/plastocyanin